jgi:hypothetical protein
MFLVPHARGRACFRNAAARTEAQSNAGNTFTNASTTHVRVRRHARGRREPTRPTHSMQSAAAALPNILPLHVVVMSVLQLKNLLHDVSPE